tara:strand:- start:9455 stop:9985 length:531 start_codon:yes stop_codon:yes gene_type:complete
MTNSNNSNNSDNSNNINSYDLIFLTNKDLYNKFLEKNEKDNSIINEDVIKYKKEIKTKMNKLLDSYLDNNINKILKSKNDNEKYKNYFYKFLSSLIENIKFQELKKSITKDLSGVKNDIYININDISNNMLSIDMLSIDMDLAEKNNKLVKKIANLNDFVTVKTPMYKQKILPKKR